MTWTLLLAGFAFLVVVFVLLAFRVGRTRDPLAGLGVVHRHREVRPESED